MTEDEWEKSFRNAMNAAAPPGKHIREDIVKEWKWETRKYHEDLPTSLRERLKWRIFLRDYSLDLAERRHRKAKRLELAHDQEWEESAGGARKRLRERYDEAKWRLNIRMRDRHLLSAGKQQLSIRRIEKMLEERGASK